MSYGENPGAVLSIDAASSLADAYDKNVPFGHASAGKDLVVSLVETGADAGRAAVGTDGQRILGKFVELHQDRTLSYMPVAVPMVLRKDASTIIPGRELLCAAAGKVKTVAEPGTTTLDSLLAASRSRGIAIEVLENTDNGRILAILP